VPPSQSPRPVEHLVEHRLGELPGERVLLRRVVAAEQHEASYPGIGPVSEAGLRPWNLLAERDEGPQRTIPGERAECDDHPLAPQQPELRDQVGQAVIPLGRRRPVSRGRAAVDGRHVRASQAQPVAGVLGASLVREFRAVERRVQPIARPIAREDAPGPVAAMGGGGQAHHHDRCLRIAESGQRLGPVRLSLEAARRLVGNPLAPFNQAGTSATADDLLRQRGQGLRHRPEARRTGATGG
jgi:hypothetical protein